MDRKQAPVAEAHPADGDDFKLIRPGIGPSVESRLRKAGIHTFEQLAALSAGEIVAHIGPMIGITADRVTSWNWQGQAKKLAEGKHAAEMSHQPNQPSESQHYATFTIQLLLDAKNEVRRTRVKHIQSGEESTWAGWEEQPLVRFLVQHAGLRLPDGESVSPETLPVPEPGIPVELTGELQMAELVALAKDTGSPWHVFSHGEPLNLRLAIDATEVMTTAEAPLACTALIYAKCLGNGPEQKVGEARATVTPAEVLALNVEGIPLDPGTYRLKANIELSAPLAGATPPPSLQAFLDGSLLQIY